MNDSLFFATFDPLYVNAPETCTLCLTEAPAFNYEYCIEQNDGNRHYIKGYCCASCAAGLMKKLAGREAEDHHRPPLEQRGDDGPDVEGLTRAGEQA